MNEIRSTAIIGMGALGMLFADQIISVNGPGAVIFAADSARIEKYRSMSFSINGKSCHFQVKDFRECCPMDLVIIAVKYNSLPSVLDNMKYCVGSETTIISVMNGITSEEMIGERYGYEKVIYCIAQGMDAVKFGGELNYSKPGELRIGIRKPMSTDSAHQNSEQSNDVLSAGMPQLERLAGFLAKSGIPFTVEDDIMYRLWGKFMLNVGVNQVCMAYETNYGGALEPGEAFDTMVKAMEEVIEIANAEGIPLSRKDMDSYIALLRTLSPKGMPSMRQDELSHRPSEVEMFAGTVRRIAAEHGIPVPVNDWLYEKIKGIEASYV